MFVVLPYIIPKGYIAIDGTFLTLTAVSDTERTFGVMLIAHTQGKVTLAQKKVGETVNIEVDMLGKYVEKADGAGLNGGAAGLQGLVERAVERALREKGI